MKVFVDADACPVKQIIIDIAQIKNVKVVMVCSYAHYSPTLHSYAHVQNILVDSAQQSTDMYIVNHIHRGDIVITQDYGLAAMVLAKKSYALHHTGFEYTPQNLDELMFRKALSAKIRRGGGKIKGPRAFSEADQQRFGTIFSALIDRRKNDLELSAE